MTLQPAMRDAVLVMLGALVQPSSAAGSDAEYPKTERFAATHDAVQPAARILQLSCPALQPSPRQCLRMCCPTNLLVFQPLAHAPLASECGTVLIVWLAVSPTQFPSCLEEPWHERQRPP